MKNTTVEEINYQDKYVRLLADMDNIRKHTTEQISKATTIAYESIVKELLPFLDSMDKAAVNDYNNEVLRKQIFDILAKFGLEEIKIKEYETPFNDDIMNAILITHVDDLECHNKVHTIIKKGYKLHDKIIRHADVGVCSINW